MQYLQIMDRGALSLVFSPVDSSAALGVEGVSDLESGGSKKISRKLSKRGSETKSEEVFAAVASEAVKLSKEAPEPAAVDLKENRENSVLLDSKKWGGRGREKRGWKKRKHRLHFYIVLIYSVVIFASKWSNM